MNKGKRGLRILLVCGFTFITLVFLFFSWLELGYVFDVGGTWLIIVGTIWQGIKLTGLWFIFKYFRVKYYGSKSKKGVESDEAFRNLHKQGHRHNKSEVLTPTCPICHSETNIRISKKGPNAGKEFHLCNGYPDCKGRILVDDLDDDILEPVVYWGLRWWSILLGVFVTIALVTVAVLVMVNYFPDPSVSVLIFTLLGIEIICFVIGGLIAGAMAGYAGVAHGWRVGFIVGVLSMLGNFIRGTYSEMDLVSVLGLIFGFIILIGFGALGGALGARLRHR